MLQAAFEIVRSHATSITNGFSIILVAAFELLVGNNIFQCPCEDDDQIALVNPYDPGLQPNSGRRYYAAAFIVWPAMAAFFMALAISGNVLRCLIEHRCGHCNIRRHCRALRFMAENATSVFVPPLAWMIIVFMDGKYYACAVSKLPDVCLPSPDAVINQSVAQNRDILERENQWHRTVSQIIGLTVLGAGITLAGSFVICAHLGSKLPYYQRRYMQLFREKEMETFATVSEACLTAELTAKWERFFRQARGTDWEDVSNLPTGSPEEIGGHYYYSDLHKWDPADPGIEPSIETHEKTLLNAEKLQVYKITPTEIPLAKMVRAGNMVSGPPPYGHAKVSPNFQVDDQVTHFKPAMSDKGTQTKDKNSRNKYNTRKVGHYDNPSYQVLSEDTTDIDDAQSEFQGVKREHKNKSSLLTGTTMVPLPRIEIENVN